MRFDDRLLTVLNQPAGDRHDAAVRWRQLVDLVARAGSSADSPTVTRALEEIGVEARNVDEALRAAAARAVAALPLPQKLLEYFASDRLTVSAPVLAAAKLEDHNWQALLKVADPETRRFIETLHPEIRVESSDLTDSLVVAEPEAPPIAPPEPETLELTPAELPPAEEPAAPEPAPRPSITPSLHEVVERIERRRRGRAAKRAAAEPQFMEGGGPALFRWECGPSGEIQWVEGAPRGPLVGRSIARPHDGNGDRVDNEVVRAFGVRAPFRDATMMIGGEGIVAGEWKISGVPAFEPADGRFAGYRGVALRELAATPAPADAASEMLSDPDSLRELVHEIKTPLNAIIGFAEIIDGQYLGPADRSYRERASDIVGQARLLLTAIDDLDFAAKVNSGTRSRKPKTHLGELVERMAPALRDEAAEREVRLDSPRTRRDVTARVELDLAERLIIRLAVAALEQAEAGERLRLSVDQTGGAARVLISRPAALGGVSDDRLFGTANGQSESFSLRLARGLARIAGADLIANASSLALVFQRA